jgi:hypothetical protein
MLRFNLPHLMTEIGAQKTEIYRLYDYWNIQYVEINIEKFTSDILYVLCFDS